MGITRASFHKRRATGGKRSVHRKKRKYEMGRPAAMTRLGGKRVRVVRCRGGNLKRRALRLEAGIYSWGTEAITKKTRILNVVHNASNNELVRTNTLVKNSIVSIDSTPFRQWYEQHYGVTIGKRSKKELKEKEVKDSTQQKQSKALKSKIHQRKKTRSLANALEDQFTTGRLLACIASRPGQSGRADGYILEGKELEFYQKKIHQKKKQTKA